MPAVQIDLPSPLPYQEQILACQKQFMCALIGRRGGKTQAGVYRILKGHASRPGIYWWVGLSWKSASMRRAWRLLKKYTRPIVGDEGIHETEKTIYLPNGSEIWMRSAENADSLAGEGIMGVVLDEFTLMAENVWTEFIYQTLLDFDGWAMFIGVPKGPGWHAQIFQNGLGADPDWQSWRLSTLEANKFIKPAAVERMRRNLTNRLYRQEILAEIIAEGGSVLPTTTCIIPCEELEPGRITSKEQRGPLQFHEYVIGCDWATEDDYTVFTVWDATLRRMVEMIRMSRIQYTVQSGVLNGLNKKWRPYVVASEETGNKFLHQELMLTNIPIRMFKTTHKSKIENVQALALAFERQELWCFDHPRIKEEFSGFMAHALPGGGVTYRGARGVKDDIPMSCMIANSSIRLMPKEEQTTGADRVNLKMAHAYSEPPQNILDGMSRNAQRSEWEREERKRDPRHYRNKEYWEWMADEGTGGAFN